MEADRNTALRTSNLCLLMTVAACLVLPSPAAALTNDQSYGSRGFAHLKNPSGRELFDVKSAPMANGQLYVRVAHFQSRRRDGKGAFISKLDSRGRPVRTFGKNGLLRTDSGIDAALNVDSKGRLLVTTVYRQGDSTDTWIVTRFTLKGKLDTAFGRRGALTFRPKRNNSIIVSTKSLPSGRVAIASGTFRADRTTQNELRIYKNDGKLDPAFDGDGIKELDFDADIAGEMSDGRLVLVGLSSSANSVAPRGTQDDAVAMVLMPDGAVDLAWGDAGYFRVGELPAQVWEAADPALQPHDPTPPKTFYFQAVGALLADGSLQIAMESTEDGDEENFKFGWGLKITPEGALDIQFGIGGAAFVADLSETGDAADSDSTTVGYFPLPDGRFMVSKYFYTSDPGVHANVSGSVERIATNGEGSKKVRFRVRSFMGMSTSTSPDGKYVYLCGLRNYRPVVARVRVG